MLPHPFLPDSGLITCSYLALIYRVIISFLPANCYHYYGKFSISIHLQLSFLSKHRPNSFRESPHSLHARIFRRLCIQLTDSLQTPLHSVHRLFSNFSAFGSQAFFKLLCIRFTALLQTPLHSTHRLSSNASAPSSQTRPDFYIFSSFANIANIFFTPARSNSTVTS